MSAGNVMAWLTCLVLAFFACVLSVHNVGTALHLEKEMAELEKKVEGMSQQPPKGVSEELARIRRSLEDISVELKEIEGSHMPEAAEELRAKLGKLSAVLFELREVLQQTPVQGGD